MIPLVAMLLFGFLALAGLVIDMGLVVLTQGQMQAVADPAALEGLRLRDAVDVNGQPVGDAGRRQAVSQLAGLVFDDDLDPVAPPTQPLLLGAGPELTLTNGLTDLNASQLITLPAQRTYLPVLQPNVANQAHGDLVAGAYTFVPRLSAREGADYQRTDFVPSDQAGSATANAFLVRLRRTNDFGGLDNQPGVSSSGTALPLLLGHGSMMTVDDSVPNPHNYSVRQHGFTVRATALADARPALRVGFPQAATATGPSLEGVVSFALDQAFWATLAVGATAGATVDAAGTIAVGTIAVAGRFTPIPPIPPAQPDPTVLTTVGQLVVPVAPVLAAEATGYVPIYQLVIEGGVPVERVVGFGHVRVTGAPPTVQLTKLPSVIAPANASRHIGQAPVLPDVTVWSTIFAANTALAVAPGAVLTPALVR